VRVEQRGTGQDRDGDHTVRDRTSPSALSGEMFDPDELRQLSGYARLAELLKEAHGVLRGMQLEVPDRADFVRRLLVITAASRHDQDDAMRRLERFLRAVDEKRGAVSLADCPAPGEDYAPDQASSARSPQASEQLRAG
jgi:hypothetical protein